jgi:hypothetical protein
LHPAPAVFEFEGEEAEAGTENAAEVEQPEVGGAPFLEEAADPVDRGFERLLIALARRPATNLQSWRSHQVGGL